MKKENVFRVLIIDDNPDVIEQLGNRITPQHKIEESVWHVDKVLITAKLELDSTDTWRLASETVTRILSECTKPFNLILLDYGFTSPGLQWSSLKKDEVISPEFLRRTRTAADLIEDVDEYLRKSSVESLALKENFTKNFKNYHGKIYLYTYTPSAVTNTYPNPDARKKRTQNAFKHSEVVLVDTQHELFDNFRYEEKYSSDFYAYLITGYLDNVINRELLKYVLVVQRDSLKYVRMKKGGLGVFAIAVIAGGIGSASAWVGETVLNLFKVHDIGTAWTVVALALFVLCLVGMGLPWLLEKFLSNMLAHLAADDDS